ILWKKDLEANAFCCTKCGYHFKIPAKVRLEMLFDDGQFIEHDPSLASTDPLQFRDRKSYRQRLREEEEKTGLKDAVMTGEGLLAGKPTIICAMEFRFVGGSMAAAEGEKITRAIDRS